MKIDSIFIENIRSHAKSYIKFSKGFNCLVGGLGAGKSSILYAIDFALFGEPLGRSYEYLLREGSDVGKVALKFIENGKEYTIWRGLRRKGERISQDAEHLKLFEADRLIAEMKSEAVAEQLRSIIGVDRDIFRDIIWIRQERLKEILDIMPSERQKRLDQLFGLSDYETSWLNLRPILKWYEGERESLERDPDVVSIKDMQAEYDEAVKDLSIVDAELEEAKREFHNAELRLKEASSRLEELEALRRENEELKARENSVKAELSSIESLSIRLISEVERRKAGINDLEERLEILNSREEDLREKLASMGLPLDISLEDLQVHIDGVIGQISSVHGESENVRNEIKRAMQRISSLMKENRCPLCLQNLSSDYKDRLMKQLYQEISNYKQRLDELERSAKELEETRSALFAIFSNLQTIRLSKEELLRRMETERRLLNETLEELNDKKRRKEDLEKQISDLLLKIAVFNLTKLEDAQKLYKEFFENHSSLKYKVQILETQKNDVVRRLGSLKERLDMAQRKIERLERVKGIAAFIDEVRQAYKSVQPKIRRDLINYLERVVQQILDDLSGLEGPSLNVRIDENYTPIIEGEEGYERSTLNLSGGERTFLAFAYRLGIGHLIMQLRAGRGLTMLLLDEPTESLGMEDGSIDRLAGLISRLKTVEQVIAVTHSEAFAEKASHVIRVEKRNGQSAVLIEQI